jgi:hypothetical protein
VLLGPRSPKLITDADLSSFVGSRSPMLIDRPQSPTLIKYTDRSSLFFGLDLRR